MQEYLDSVQTADCTACVEFELDQAVLMVKYYDQPPQDNALDDIFFMNLSILLGCLQLEVTYPTHPTPSIHIIILYPVSPGQNNPTPAQQEQLEGGSICPLAAPAEGCRRDDQPHIFACLPCPHSRLFRKHCNG